MRRLVAAALIAAVMITVTAMTPRKAEATDNLVYIIPAAVSGALVVALVVAILVANHSKEPELDLAQVAPPPEPTGGIQFGRACRRPSGEMPLLCW